MHNVQIITLRPDEWQLYKDIRLQALKNEPSAFLSTYEEMKDKLETKWRKDLDENNNSNKDLCLFLKLDGKIIGMVGIYTKEEKEGLVAYPWGIYVDSQFRGRGYGELLMKRIMDGIVLNNKISKFSLCVNVDNLAALNLYKKLGFRIIGDMKTKAIRGLYDEYLMEK